MKIPYDASGIRSKMKAAFTGTVTKKTEPNDAAKRVMGSDIAKERAKRKAIADELANANTTATRRQEIIDGLTAQNEALQTELEEHKGLVEELTPAAKAWKSYEHKERAKLIESFPPEKRKAMQKIADSLDLEGFKEIVNLSGGKSGGSQQQTKDGAKDWETILTGTDPDAIGKAIDADPTGYNAFMETVGK